MGVWSAEEAWPEENESERSLHVLHVVLVPCEEGVASDTMRGLSGGSRWSGVKRRTDNLM